MRTKAQRIARKKRRLAERRVVDRTRFPGPDPDELVDRFLEDALEHNEDPEQSYERDE